jgi:hypothetical protein
LNWRSSVVEELCPSKIRDKKGKSWINFYENWFGIFFMPEPQKPQEVFL